MFWLTEGKPEDWPTLLHWLDYNTFHRHDQRAISIISKVLNKEMKFDFFDDETSEVLTPTFERMQL